MNREGIGVNMNPDVDERFEAMMEKLRKIEEQIVKMQKEIEFKDKYIKHLETMLDEKLRVV